MGLELLVQRMAAAGLSLTSPCEEICEGFAIIREHRLNLAMYLLFDPFHERFRVLRGLAAPNF